MANAKEIKERMASIEETRKPNKEYSGYQEDHQCHVSDLFFEDETGQEKAC